MWPPLCKHSVDSRYGYVDIQGVSKFSFRVSDLFSCYFVDSTNPTSKLLYWKKTRKVTWLRIWNWELRSLVVAAIFTSPPLRRTRWWPQVTTVDKYNYLHKLSLFVCVSDSAFWTFSAFLKFKRYKYLYLYVSIQYSVMNL